ncbi:MAG: 4Fe-4S dicluster domain-containing protein [Desulfosarcina sp.]|nr:4Fe-4S dicluster domain-containing protein [Desulfobacterales bacterium]
MKVIKIDKTNWIQGIENLRDSYKLTGPVKGEKFYNFQELDNGEVPDLNYSNTRLSTKSIVFPQSEVMLNYTIDESKDDHHIMKEIDTDYAPRALIGLRPCDAKALTLVKLNFDTTDYKDPYWLKAYEATTFVGLACDDPLSTCFCTTAGSGPYNEEGLDLLLVDAGDHYLAKVITDKGATLLETAGWKIEAGDISIIETKKSDAEAKITSKIKTDKLKEKDTLEIHSAPFWEDVSFACLNCGTCTFVCPTCWCFDIQDEVHGNDGTRMRNWDSCMFPLFTLHTTGHNPRGEKIQRVRQRFMHKLKYFVDKYEKGIMCVGCGRCVSQCPVYIDIRSICEKMNSYELAV